MSNFDYAVDRRAGKTSLRLVIYRKDYKKYGRDFDRIVYKNFPNADERELEAKRLKALMMQPDSDIVRLELEDEIALLDKDYDKGDGKLYRFDYSSYKEPRGHAALTLEVRVLLDAYRVLDGFWAHMQCESHEDRLLLAQAMISDGRFKFGGYNHVFYVGLVDRVLYWDNEFVVHHGKLGSPLADDREWSRRAAHVIAELKKQATA